MRLLRCPRCAVDIDLPDSQAGPVGTCPECGQRFRIPPRQGSSKSPAVPKGKSGSGERVAAEGYAVNAGPPPAPRPRKVGPEPESDEDEPEDSEQELEEELQEEQPLRKRRRKKRKAASRGNIDPAHVAMAVVGVAVLLLIAGGIFIFQKVRPHKQKEDPQQALAALQKAGVALKREPGTQEVLGASFSSTGTDFKGSLLGHLLPFPKLTEIDLSGTTAKNTDLEWLEGLTSVTKLRLHQTNVNDGGMRYIGQFLPNLEELDLGQTLVTDGGLSDLKGLKKLRKLSLRGSLASGLGLAGSIPNLEISK